MRLIDADALMEKLNGIWDCNDMTFEPVDECCIDADCKSCRWRETIEYVKRLVQNQTTISPWHRVEDGLPDDSRDVIIFHTSGIVGVGSFIRPNWYQWYSGGGLPVDVTHWMPLPEPPKEAADG